MRAREVLDPSDYEEYLQGWANFQEKGKLESKFNVHSSRPVVSRPYTFVRGDVSVGRARVFQGLLRGIDPYCVTCKYANPFWHPIHYFISTEQAYHAMTNKIRDNSRHVVKDAVDRMMMKIPVFWENSASVEVTLKKGTDARGFMFMEHVNFTVLSDDRLPAAQMEIRAYGNHRSYLREFEKMKSSVSEADREAAKASLMAKINMQWVKHSKWSVDRRANMKDKHERILAGMVDGTVCERDLYDFFSLWELPKSARSLSDN